MSQVYERQLLCHQRHGWIHINSPDHGIEQENCELKVIGGIVGITQNEKSLDKYLLIAPEVSNLQHEFEKKNILHWQH